MSQKRGPGQRLRTSEAKCMILRAFLNADGFTLTRDQLKSSLSHLISTKDVDYHLSNPEHGMTGRRMDPKPLVTGGRGYKKRYRLNLFSIAGLSSVVETLMKDPDFGSSISAAVEGAYSKCFISPYGDFPYTKFTVGDRWTSAPEELEGTPTFGLDDDFFIAQYAEAFVCRDEMLPKPVLKAVLKISDEVRGKTSTRFKVAYTMEIIEKQQMAYQVETVAPQEYLQLRDYCLFGRSNQDLLEEHGPASQGMIAHGDSLAARYLELTVLPSLRGEPCLFSLFGGQIMHQLYIEAVRLHLRMMQDAGKAIEERASSPLGSRDPTSQGSISDPYHSEFNYLQTKQKVEELLQGTSNQDKNNSS